MIIKHIVRIANLLKVSIKDATAYCDEVRRATGLGKQLSDASIARQLLGQKPPYPEAAALASIIKQQETFRIITVKNPSGSQPGQQEYSATPTSETLEKCPYCRKRFKLEELHQHTKLFHATDLKLALEKENLKTPILDGIEVKSPELARELKRRVIDEQGFLISTDLITETKTDNDQEGHFHRTGSTQKVEQPGIFDSIKSLATGIPGARTKKLRPEPNQQVLCPVCHKHTEYQNLFDHVTKRHPEQNARAVLARFNRGYEIWAKNRSK